MKQSRGGKIALAVVMLSIACAVALPFYYIVVNTFKTQQQTSESPLGLPSSLSLSKRATRGRCSVSAARAADSRSGSRQPPEMTPRRELAAITASAPGLR